MNLLMRGTAIARLFLIVLVPGFLGPSPLSAQEADDPWMDSLQNSKGMSVGSLEPRYGPLGKRKKPSGSPTAAGGGGTGGGTPGSPAAREALDPNEPEIAGLIREWISLAEPPQNATVGGNWRYDKWGRMYGSGGGVRTVSMHDKPVYALATPEETVWSFRTKLDSIDHCTLEQYVLAKLDNKSIAGCAGRYKGSVSKLVGMPKRQAEEVIKKFRFRPAIRAGRPAESRDESGKVERQRPNPGTKLKRGEVVTLWIHSPYVESRSVPDLAGMSSREARSALAKVGLGIALRPGGAARSPEQTGKVEKQKLAPGTKVKPGTEVEITVYSPYVDLREVPKLVGLSSKKAKEELRLAGLKVDLKIGKPAPAAEKSGKVEVQRPEPGTKVKAGTEVRVTIYSNYVDLRTVPNLVGLSSQKAKAELDAAGLKAKLSLGRPALSAQDSGKVASQRPKQGTKLKAGSRVEIRIYTNYVRTANVPNVVGLMYSQAKDRLRAAGLMAVRGEAGSPPSRGQSERVNRQNPSEGTQVKEGAGVTVYVYSKYVSPVEPIIKETIETEEPSTSPEWVLVQTRINPAGYKKDFSKTTGSWTSIRRGSASNYSLRWEFKGIDKHRGVLKDMTWNFEVKNLPKKIKAGVPVKFKLKGVVTNNIGKPFAEVVYAEIRIPGIKDGSSRTRDFYRSALRINATLPDLTKNITLKVPSSMPDGFEIHFHIGETAAYIVWVYRKQVEMRTRPGRVKRQTECHWGERTILGDPIGGYECLCNDNPAPDSRCRGPKPR